MTNEGEPKPLTIKEKMALELIALGQGCKFTLSDLKSLGYNKKTAGNYLNDLWFVESTGKRGEFRIMTLPKGLELRHYGPPHGSGKTFVESSSNEIDPARGRQFKNGKTRPGS